MKERKQEKKKERKKERKIPANCRVDQLLVDYECQALIIPNGLYKFRNYNMNCDQIMLNLH